MCQKKAKTTKYCTVGSELMKVPKRTGSSSTSYVSEKICYIPEYVKIAEDGKDLKYGLRVKINVMQNLYRTAYQKNRKSVQIQNYRITEYCFRAYPFNPLKAELNPICKSQLAELFCGVFKILRTLFEKPEYFEN
jgi:hypothetical protein